MGWSISLGTVKGTAIRVHFTFLLLLAWFAVLFYFQGGAPSALAGLSFLLLLFACVVLHEFGHILAARHFGVRTREILLLPIGGMARMDRIPEQPRQEFLMALAGPAVTLAIALLLLLALGGPPDPNVAFSDVGIRNLVGQLAYANLTLLGFNLLPVFPLDGGRVLRALLSSRFGHSRGTHIAAVIGQAVAVIFAIIGLSIGNVILVLIAAFVFFTAGAEAGLAQLREVSFGVPARDVMISQLEVLSPTSSIDDAAKAVIRTSQHEFPVVDQAGVLSGVLTRDKIISALSEQQGTSQVRDVMRSDIPSISEWQRLDDILELLQSGIPAVAVTSSDNRLVGLITSENLVENMMIARARDKRTRNVRNQVSERFSLPASTK